MRPGAAVGINMAIADAVAAGNLLATPLKRGALQNWHLAGVQRRREWHTRLVQWFQAALELQNWAAGRGSKMPLAARLVAGIPVLRDLRNHVLVCGGLWAERVSSV